MGGQNQSTTDAGSLNTFDRNEIEVALISSALLSIACLVILYKAITQLIELSTDCAGTSQRPEAFSVPVDNLHDRSFVAAQTP
jgi:hypothetical protein